MTHLNTWKRSILLRLTLINLILGALLMGGLSSAFALDPVIPANRQIDWSASGVPGGIPFRTVIFADVTKAPFNAVGDGSTDNTAAIQNALNGCPAGEVVYIPAGTYKISGALTVPSNITVRGAGVDQTIIKPMGTGGGNGVFTLGTQSVSFDPTSQTSTISSGATAGSTSLVLNTVSGITTASSLIISETNDPAYVSLYGAEKGPPGRHGRMVGAIVARVPEGRSCTSLRSTRLRTP